MTNYNSSRFEVRGAEEGAVFHYKVFCDVLITIGLIVFLFSRRFEAEIISGLVLDCREEYALRFHLDRVDCIL